MGGRDPDRWVAEQIEYYDRRAREYDETFPSGDTLEEQWAELVAALRAFEPRGRVLEIACGTGQFTVELVPFADEITALDASPEMIERSRARVSSDKVRYVLTDVFGWVPDAAYDVAFFSFWLSHVPPSHFERFWNLVARCLRPDGRVFFMDEGRHTYWEEEFVDPAGGVVRRELLDGSEHHAIKVLWDATELEEKLRALGWDIAVRSTGAVYWGQGRRAG